MVDNRQVNTGDSIAMAIMIGIAGSVITLLMTLVLGRLVDGITADWPAPANVLEALLVACVSRLHLVVATLGLYVTGRLVVHTVLHDRDQLHHRLNREQDVELREREAYIERIELENKVAGMKLQQLQAGGKPADLQINAARSSAWALVVSMPDKRTVTLEGKMIEAYARRLREGRVSRQLLKDEGLHFTYTDYTVLRVLMRQGGVETDEGVKLDQLTNLLELWRTTKAARVYQDADAAYALQLGAPADSSRARA